MLQKMKQIYSQDKENQIDTHQLNVKAPWRWHSFQLFIWTYILVSHNNGFLNIFGAFIDCMTNLARYIIIELNISVLVSFYWMYISK